MSILDSLELDEALTQLVDARGTVAPREAARLLNVDRQRASRALRRLSKDGEVRAIGQGRFASAEPPRLLSDSGRQIHDTLGELGRPAHLTGYDLLRGLEHQVTLGAVPHLVYADGAALEEVGQTLALRGFTVAPAQVGAELAAADLDRVVLMRKQAAGLQRRLAVADYLASPEKAWLDLVREVERRSLPLAPYDIGRILGTALFLDIIDLVRLERVANQAGWWARIEPIVAKRSTGPEEAILRQIYAGYQAEAPAS